MQAGAVTDHCVYGVLPRWLDHHESAPHGFVSADVPTEVEFGEVFLFRNLSRATKVLLDIATA